VGRRDLDSKNPYLTFLATFAVAWNPPSCLYKLDPRIPTKMKGTTVQMLLTGENEVLEREADG
jgi:hypothetical protein